MYNTNVGQSISLSKQAFLIGNISSKGGAYSPTLEDFFMKEIWMDVKNYEGLYRISNIGRVMSLKRKYCNGGILKPSDNLHGYLQVVLCKNSRCKAMKISRLVAIHFVPNPNNLETVNHKDGNKLNNSYTNLEWLSVKNNVQHSINILNIFGARKLNEFQVNKIRNLRKNKSLTYKEIAKLYNISASNVGEICKNLTWKNI